MLYKLMLCLLILTFSSYAQENPEVSPNAAWGEFQVVKKEEQTTLSKVLLWIPNRVADLLDVVKLDLGLGPATGGVIRVTKNFQMGYRNVHPMSVRAGLFGRDYPFLIESSSEIGISPTFRESKDRTICDSEIGVGADLFIAGAYGGICLQEAADFFAGLFFIDLNEDDW